MEGVDVVFHAAGVVDYWRQGIERMYQVNIDGTRHVMEAALRWGQPRRAYQFDGPLGIHPNPVADESFTFNIQPERFVYGHSKFQAEQVVFEYIRLGLPAVIVNPTTVIGPPRRSQGIQWDGGGGGQPLRPAVDPARRHEHRAYLRCCPGRIEAALKGHAGERYSWGENMTLLQLYQTIAEVVGCGMKMKAMPRWLVTVTAGLTDMLQPSTSGPVPLTGARLRLEAQMFYFDGSQSPPACSDAQHAPAGHHWPHLRVVRDRWVSLKASASKWNRRASANSAAAPAIANGRRHPRGTAAGRGFARTGRRMRPTGWLKWID